MEVQVAYADRNISGHVETGGQQRPIQLALDAPALLQLRHIKGDSEVVGVGFSMG